MVAEFVVGERQSVVLDLSLLRKGDQGRFMTDFAETPYHRNRAPLHLVLDEADAFAPQRPMPGEHRMLGALEDLVRRGRARGIGVTLVTQRAAVLNKNVLTQCEVLVALRTIAPQDREAIDAWVKVHGTPAQREELMASRPSLPVGTAWVWSPGWLDMFKRVEIRRRETFDSSSTPRAGAQPAAPKRLADVDLEALKGRIAATIERAKAEDPRELRRQLAEAKAELARVKATPPPTAKGKPVEIPGLKAVEIKALERTVARVDAAVEAWGRSAERLAAVEKTGQDLAGQLVAAARGITEALVRLRVGPSARVARPASAPAPPVRASVSVPRRASAPSGDTGTGLTGPARKLLTALAQHGGRATDALAILTGYAASGGAFRNPLGALRSKGYVDGRGTVEATPAGLEALGTWDPLPTGEALPHQLTTLSTAKRRWPSSGRCTSRK